MGKPVLNLTVIGDLACGTTRTYLTYLKAEGLKVRRLWLINFGKTKLSERLIRRAFGLSFSDYLVTQVRERNVYLPSADSDYVELTRRLQVEAGFDAINHFSAWDPSVFAEEVQYFSASDYTDADLQKRIVNSRDTAFLYTNGGIVPKSLLTVPDVKFLHIHPGIVPQMKGSDCLLWSALLRNKLGVSCFYMSAGIDEGEVLGKLEVEVPSLPSLAPLLNDIDEPLAYQALLFAVDPHLRARLLVSVLASVATKDLRRLESSQQESDVYSAYLWMHPRLRLQAMRRSFL